MSIEIDNGNFLKLLHAMIRDDKSPNEPERSRSVMIWAGDKGLALSKVMNFEQRRLMSLVFEHFRKFNEAPSLTILRQRIERTDKGDGMEALLKEYTDHRSTFDVYTARDADPLFAEISQEWKKYQFSALLKTALNIVIAGVPGDPKKKEKDLSGPDDARMYLLKELQSSLFAPEMGNIGGTIADTADKFANNYAINKEAAKNDSLVIATGVPALDASVHGMRRGTVNLILGHAGQRKSALARTLAYNAVISGFRVLFLPLEINFNDELSYFGLIHSHNPKYFDNILDMSIDRYQRGLLTPAEEKAIRERVVPDLKENIGDRLIIRQLADTTWENIRSVIELENFIAPLDMVVLDYIGLLDTHHQKDKTFAINEAAIQMKQMALTFPNGKGGLIIVTPVQSSRKGYEEAKTNDGTWDKTGIFMYSELEKSADIIFYTYLSAELQAEGKLKLGTCKSRNTADAPTQIVPINLSNGYIGLAKKDKETTEKPKNTEVRDPSLVGAYPPQ